MKNISRKSTPYKALSGETTASSSSDISVSDNFDFNKVKSKSIRKTKAKKTLILSKNLIKQHSKRPQVKIANIQNLTENFFVISQENPD